jgi:SAM-dependent methyltransferase
VTDAALPPELEPLSHLDREQKAVRAASFGGVASHYERYRPGPPAVAVDWLLPSRVAHVVDLGAGTGALTRLLVDRADEVVAVDPDERMRAVLVEEFPGVQAVDGQGEAMPLPDGWADAVLASSSWHWVDPRAGFAEVARVLAPGGLLGTIWGGPDQESPFLAQAQAMLSGRSEESELASFMAGDGRRPVSTLELTPDAPFSAPEHEVFRWDVPLNTDDLIGLLGTFSWVITMPDEARKSVFSEARRLLKELLGVEGEVTVDVGFKADVWRTRLLER